MQKCGQRRMPDVDHFGDALYSGFVALATILHGACVFLYIGYTLYSGFVALATILHGACAFLSIGDTTLLRVYRACNDTTWRVCVPLYR